MPDPLKQKIFDYLDNMSGIGGENPQDIKFPIDTTAFKKMTFPAQLQLLVDRWPEIEKDPKLLSFVKDMAYKVFSMSPSAYRDNPIDIISFLTNPQKYREKIGNDEFTGTQSDQSVIDYIKYFKPQYKKYNTSIWKGRNMNRNYVYQDTTGFQSIPKNIMNKLNRMGSLEPINSIIKTEEDKPDDKYFYFKSLPMSGDSIDYEDLKEFYSEELIPHVRTRRNLPPLSYEELQKEADLKLSQVGPPPNTVIYSTDVGSKVFPVQIFDDATGVTTQTLRDKQGNLFFTVKDLWNFAPNYTKEWKFPIGKSLIENQRFLAEKAGKQFGLGGWWPVRKPKKR